MRIDSIKVISNKNNNLSENQDIHLESNPNCMNSKKKKLHLIRDEKYERKGPQ